MEAHRWAPPEWHATIDSTNLAVLADPTPGRVVVAEHQSAGQGRRGRAWTAPPDTSLAITVAVSAPPPGLIGWVPLVAGLAVVRALSSSRYAVSAGLKWPNDVLVLEGTTWRKVCGVLAQVAPAAHAAQAVVVLGAGVNIDQSRDQLPVPTATSWRLARGGAVLPDGTRQAWVVDYLAHLAQLLDTLRQDPDQVRAAYRACCRTLGQQVRVDLPGETSVSGVATGIDDSGALVVEGRHGTSRHHAGDVVHLRRG